LIFFTSEYWPLASLTNATPTQLQQAFSAPTATQRLRSGAGQSHLHQRAISGQGNVAEATVFRVHGLHRHGKGSVLGLSQESNVARIIHSQASQELALAVSAQSSAIAQRGGKVGPKLFREIRWTGRHRYGLSATATTARLPIAPLTVTSNWTVSTALRVLRRLRPGQPLPPVLYRVLPICPLPALALSLPESEIWTADSRSPTSAMALIVLDVLRLVTNAKGKVAAND